MCPWDKEFVTIIELKTMTMQVIGAKAEFERRMNDVLSGC